MRIAGRVIVAASLLGLIVGSTPVAAGDGGRASGVVSWLGESGDSPGLRTSWFTVVDGGSGGSDRGTYRFSREGVGTLVIDVACAKVQDDWAEFAGPITEASGVYTVGEVFLVSVKDGGRHGTDEIGMKSKASVEAGCVAALNDQQFGRKGVILHGDIRVRSR